MGGFLEVYGFADVTPAQLLEWLKPYEDAEGEPIAVFDPGTGHSICLSELNGWPLDEIGKANDLVYLRAGFGEEAYWFYDLFRGKELIDRFSTVPNYWKELSAEEYQSYQGNAEIVAATWPGVQAADIKHYLVDHTKLPRRKARTKAYRSDSFQRWDCWQVADFLGKLGVPYPVEEDGEDSFPMAGMVPVLTITQRRSKN